MTVTEAAAELCRSRPNVYRMIRRETLADPSAPASAGDVIWIYCAGLSVVVELSALTLSASLVADSAGLYKVPAVVPQGVAPDSAVPVILTVAVQ